MTNCLCHADTLRIGRERPPRINAVRTTKRRVDPRNAPSSPLAIFCSIPNFSPTPVFTHCWNCVMITLFFLAHHASNTFLLLSLTCAVARANASSGDDRRSTRTPDGKCPQQKKILKELKELRQLAGNCERIMTAPSSQKQSGRANMRETLRPYITNA